MHAKRKRMKTVISMMVKYFSAFIFINILYNEIGLHCILCNEMRNSMIRWNEHKTYKKTNQYICKSINEKMYMHTHFIFCR